MATIEAIEAIEDDAEFGRASNEKLAELTSEQERLRKVRQDRAQALRAKGMTWPEIGVLLGVTSQRAHVIATGMNSNTRRKLRKDGAP